MTTPSTLREPEGIHNFREVGPYRLSGGGAIRGERIYRSGALEQMTAADAAWLAEELGLRTVLDLRHGDEIALRRGVGPIQWASAETSAVWNGYMEGAVRAGEAEAAAIIRRCS